MMVLLIVDVQRAFVNRHTRHIPAIVESLQTQYSHVFASRFINRAGSPWRRWMDWNGCSAGTPEANLAFDAAPRTAVFEKTGYSAAGRTLLKDLAEIGEQEIAVCGMDTDACVLATALDLFSAGVRPVVLTHACSSSGGPELHRAGLRLLERSLGRDQLVGEKP